MCGELALGSVEIVPVAQVVLYARGSRAPAERGPGPDRLLERDAASSSSASGTPVEVVPDFPASGPDCDRVLEMFAFAGPAGVEQCSSEIDPYAGIVRTSSAFREKVTPRRPRRMP
jgi:hypothetical protein